MAVVVFANLKGGVGKTTLATNVAGEFVTDNAKVVLVDADAQRSATEWADAGEAPFRVVPLALKERHDAPVWLDRVRELDGEHDWVIVDTPPQEGDAMQAAFAIADVAVIPTTASVHDVRAAGKALRELNDARSEREDGGPAALLVASRIDWRTLAGREIEGVLHEMGEAVGPAVGQKAAFVDAVTAGQTIGQFAPRSQAHREIQRLASVVRRRA